MGPGLDLTKPGPGPYPDSAKNPNGPGPARSVPVLPEPDPAQSRPRPEPGLARHLPGVGTGLGRRGIVALPPCSALDDSTPNSQTPIDVSRGLLGGRATAVSSCESFVLFDIAVGPLTCNMWHLEHKVEGGSEG